MARHKVEISGVNTANIKVLSSKEMEVLFIKLQSGDLTAKDELVNGNLKLVLSLLKRFNKKNVNMDDLFQTGCIGLLKAIDNFDLKYKVLFSTYAVPMILGEVKRFLREDSGIRISRSIKDLSYKIIRAKEELININGFEPNIYEIADYLEVPIDQAVTAFESMREVVSLFEPIYNDGGDTIYLCDQIEDKSLNNEEIELRMSVDDALEKLKYREKFILDKRFIMGKTQMEVALELGISQAQVSRLEQGAIKSVKKILK